MESNFYYLNFIIIFVINIFFYLNRNIIYKYFNLVDKPDGKLKIHKSKIFAIGGLIFFITIISYFLLSFLNESSFSQYTGSSYFEKTALLFGIMGMFFLGFYDDKYNLDYQVKIILSSLIMYICLSIDESLIITKLEFTFVDKILYLRELDKFITILFILLFINALNLFDGLDLQSGSYIFILVSIFSFYFKINFFIFLLIPSIIFLYLNFKKEIFLGDSGSLLLGFIFSYFLIKLYNFTSIKSDQLFILMMVPGIDMMRLFFLRIIRGKNPFKGDRNHIHHILLSKFGFLKTLLLTQSLIILSIFSLLIMKIPSLIIIFFTLMIYFFLIYKNK